MGANEILKRMEVCSPLAIQLSTNHHELKDFTSAGSYQRIYPDYPRHLSFTKVALPTPTRAIYNMVLLLYAKEVGGLHVAEQAEDVVWSMILRMMQQSKAQFHDATQSDPKTEDLIPSIDNWNCVLECWSRNTHPSRAFHSFAFLRSWLEFNEFCQNSVGIAEEVGAQFSQPNAKSYDLLLQSCLSCSDTGV